MKTPPLFFRSQGAGGHLASRLARLAGMLALCAAAHAWPAPARPAAAPVPIAGIVDGRVEFRAVFCALMRRDSPRSAAGCNDWLRRFPDEARPAGGVPLGAAPRVNIVIVGGLFGECLPAVPTFGDAALRLRAGGYRVSHVAVKGRASSEANAAIIRAHVAREVAAAPAAPLIIVAYSKGVADAMTALAAYPELGDTVDALISVAGVVQGSDAADRMLRLYGATAALLPYSACPVGDGGELRSLTHAYRRAWLAARPLPARPLYFSIVGLPLPERVSAVFSVFGRRLSRLDRRNDGQMIYSDAILPHSSLLAYANADHFAIALPIAGALSGARLAGIDRNDFPRAELVEAAIRVAHAHLAAKAR